MTILNYDDLPVFTYVATFPGWCKECRKVFLAGDTVVRVGVACANNANNGWRQYHPNCWKLLSHKETP